MITHYDLFAGIGGFSLALEEVFSDETIRHIFCEWESFPTAVLKQHWPDGEYWGDIAELATHTDQRQSRPGASTESDEASQLERSPARAISGDASNSEHTGLERRSSQGERHNGQPNRTGRDKNEDWTIITGGFPCQPFSSAGRRKGTADDRYQWPNMFAVIRHVKPEWVIAENVRGLVTWNDGLVLETVCADLESEGYEVQPFIIPACAVGAPHRRDRVWIIANRRDERRLDRRYHRQERQVLHDQNGLATENKPEWEGRLGRIGATDEVATDARPQRRSERSSQKLQSKSEESERSNRQYPDWSRNWQEVAFATCDDAMDDGLPRLVDGVPYSRAKWRKDSLKAYGNGIVMQVAVEIFRAIQEMERK